MPRPPEEVRALVEVVLDAWCGSLRGERNQQRMRAWRLVGHCLDLRPSKLDRAA